MRRILCYLLVVGFIISGCATKRWPISPSIGIGKTYTIGTTHKCPVGSQAIRIQNQREWLAFTPAFEYDSPPVGYLDSFKLVPGQIWVATHSTSSGYIVANIDVGFTIGISINADGTIDQGWETRAVLGPIFKRRHRWTENKLFVETDSVVAKGTFAAELLYSGFSHGTVRLTYRELKDDMARPAFYQELTYDLEESKTIVFRSIKIEVIEATNSYLSFKVLDDGNLPWMPRQ